MIKIIAALRKERESKKISQAEMAERLGVTKVTFNHYENGKQVPKLDMVLEWQSILGVNFLEIKV